MNVRPASLILALGLMVAAACSSKKDDFSSVNIHDYLPLTPGKYIIYKVDSVLFPNFGSVRETHSYVFRDLVDQQLTDNIGRPSFRMKRQRRDPNNAAAWLDHSTYLITPLTNTIELIENNNRFVKLTMPVKDQFPWSGNGYLPLAPFEYLFEFSSGDHNQLESWYYIYSTIESPLSVNGKTFDNTITVETDSPDSTNIPVVNPAQTGNKTVWRESYAKGIGLVYRQISLVEYQSPNSSNPQGAYTGFELTMSVLEYN
ncbi:MAG: hypothetical protein H7Y27_15690 [Gemmatimonadaceae bacterium]|nr:hypothetical protein [Chitinophagaceae bacterium]